MSPDQQAVLWPSVAAVAALLLGLWVGGVWTRRRLGSALATSTRELTRLQIVERRLTSQVGQLNAVTASDAAAIAELRTQQDDMAALRSRVQQVEAQSLVIERLYNRIAQLEPQAARGRELVALMGAWQSAAAAAGAHDLTVRIDEIPVLTPIEASAVAAVRVPTDQPTDHPTDQPPAYGPATDGPATEMPATDVASAEVDDLTRVAGIGPAIDGLMKTAGIRTLQDLSQTPVARLREILDTAGPRFARHRPDVWPAQAAALITANAGTADPAAPSPAEAGATESLASTG